jgi:hypothetical protein
MVPDHCTYICYEVNRRKGLGLYFMTMQYDISTAIGYEYVSVCSK